ncbi:hypothetical protein GA0074692_0490 [Micromonospora pallida]|uniref:Uncharacterized protein n=1 Tax=Micromonospora pallida TaxID=145854 RepID=A0A1C6RP68_9ACTN|nr:hypothetical protein GA0074692_0490 [Micromonospora pallida]
MTIAGPAHAGVWVDGGIYSSESACHSTGSSRVASGMYQTYTCTFGTWSSSSVAPAGTTPDPAITDDCDRCGTRGYLLRGYMN